ncbi:XRE family transcriptional regulator [Paenibacillus endoradicis]|uniref:XRE family transcriptional regulator n=1 Tax=Paenibacillus endoradicis TaxID=2972487 RepID=UPI0021597FF9|nr:XRE family transcriptional regulator [Paenibacillus endoradicis]MCR8658950.1 XRE family transcriptional regulator [Paenibacillus endoradicis]
MFRNLEAEMARNGVNKGDFAKFLGVRYATVIDKTKGRNRFYLDEASKIQRHFFPNCTIEYLFEQDNHNTPISMKSRN